MKLVNFITGRQFSLWSYSNRGDYISLGADDMDQIQLQHDMKDKQPYLMYHGITYPGFEPIPPEFIQLYDVRPMIKETALNEDKEGQPEFIGRRLNNLEVLELVYEYGTHYGKEIQAKKAEKKRRKKRTRK